MNSEDANPSPCSAVMVPPRPLIPSQYSPAIFLMVLVSMLSKMRRAWMFPLPACPNVMVLVLYLLFMLSSMPNRSWTLSSGTAASSIMWGVRILGGTVLMLWCSAAFLWFHHQSISASSFESAMILPVTVPRIPAPSSASSSYSTRRTHSISWSSPTSICSITWLSTNSRADGPVLAILMPSDMAFVRESYPSTKRRLCSGSSIRQSSADRITPRVPSEPTRILCVSSMVLTRSSLYPEEFFVTCGNLSIWAKPATPRIFSPTSLSSGRVIVLPVPSTNVTPATLSITLPYLTLLLPPELFPSMPPIEQNAPTDGLGANIFPCLPST